MFYDYDHNGFLLTILICNIISLISIILIILFYIVGNGSQYFIQKLYLYQVIVLLMFFMPQTIGPFFYSEQYKQSDNQKYCNISYKDKNYNALQAQQCMTDGFCKFQGITNNGAWFASSLLSFLSSYAIQRIIVEQRQIKKEFSKYLILIAILTIACNFCSCFAKFRHYGVQYGDQNILYICNLDLDVKGFWMMWWIFQLMINTVVFCFGLYQYHNLQKSIKKLQLRLHQNLNSIKALKIQAMLLIIIIFWTINILIKLVEEYILNMLFEPVQVILFMFMIPIQLLGFFYAEFYFYSFQDHLNSNLAPCYKVLLNILVKFNLATCYFSYQRNKEIKIEDDQSSSVSNEASLIYNQNEISAN